MNKFYVRVHGTVIVRAVPTGCYEIESVNKYIKNALGDEDSIDIRANTNTLPILFVIMT
jgi:hypothetical protein